MTTAPYCQCCGEALLPTARALICAACHNATAVRHCRLYCALHNNEIDPERRREYVPPATATAGVFTTTIELDRGTVDAIRAEWERRTGGDRPLRFHTRGDLGYDY